MGYYNYDNYGNGRGGFLQMLPPATRHIIIINLLLFVATLINEDFRPWQILTHMFMHGGFWHVFFNMYTFFIFGTVLERALGTKRFLIFYFVTGLGAAALHTGVEWIQASVYLSSGTPAAMSSYYDLLRTPVLGASGAIYGVLIGYAMFYPNSILTLIFPPVSLKAKWFVLIFAGIELLTGVTGTADGVAHFAHLGGMLFGWLLILWWRKRGKLYY